MKEKEQIKNTGATFTPKELAVFLAERIASYISNAHQKVLDPACGEGELLLAMGHTLLNSNISFDIAGFDTNNIYLDITKNRLKSSFSNEMCFFCEDFLQAIDIRNNNNTIDLFQGESCPLNNCYDIVIANPPYVRTQILGSEQAQMLAKKFQLKGRVDLYYPFLIAMTESLKEGGILGVITSNRYLSTKSGESVRQYLSTNYDILELIDLGDTKLFEAAVLPAIFIGKKATKRKSTPSTFIKIYEDLNGNNSEFTSTDSIINVLKNKEMGCYKVGDKFYKKTIGTLKYEVGTKSSWSMFSGEEYKWVSKIDSAAKNHIEDFFKVKVGIKSTADKVFISDNWDDLKEIKPEDELLKDLISQENINAWHATTNSKLKVLYPHICVNGKKTIVDIHKYPNAEMYLLQHEEILRSRKYLIDAGRQWYELWVPHRPEVWAKPKLVFPDISSIPRFYFDTDGKIVNGNCYWIVAKNEKETELLMLIQGVANSKLMTKYHDLVFNNKLYSGKRRYITQYVEKYPLPDINSPSSTEIISIVRELNKSSNILDISKLENLLEISVAKAFSVDPVFNLD
ncbi:N-6 DNA methylase [Butyricimonas faecihominis]|uniref:Eco57I restriction-modification methylase domain-containing protein n=1 Tax=Butyricimonas faecihominis TaxID=1472416 RepID=UPI0032C066FE